RHRHGRLARPHRRGLSDRKAAPAQPHRPFAAGSAGQDLGAPEMRRMAMRLRGAAIIAGILATWEAASACGLLSPFLFPPPSRIAEALFELVAAGFPDGVVLSRHLVITVVRIVQGFVAAMILAIPIGLMIGRSPTFDALMA